MTALYKILVTGYRPTFSVFSFEPSTAKVKLVADSPAPPKTTWVELAENPSATAQNGERCMYTLSDKEGGSAVSLKLIGDEVQVTGERVVHGGPVHIHVMKDRSGIVVSNFSGGSVLFLPTTLSGALSTDSESPLLTLPFLYESQPAPNPKRQEASHAHNVVERGDGTLYLSDLGNDRIWKLKREGDSGLAIAGWLQAPLGSGPRHSLISKDGKPFILKRAIVMMLTSFTEKYLYNVTELSNEILIFPLTPSSEQITHSLSDFKCSVIPPSVPAAAHSHLNAAQLIFHPLMPHILYASNRLELSLPQEFATGEPGDAVAVITLSSTGDSLVDVKYVRTGCNGIRGMRASPDGKYVSVAGRYGGGLEIWSVGQSGVDWRLAGKDENIDLVTDMAWL